VAVQLVAGSLLKAVELRLSVFSRLDVQSAMAFWAVAVPVLGLVLGLLLSVPVYTALQPVLAQWLPGRQCCRVWQVPT
jgi:hypothetical protein